MADTTDTAAPVASAGDGAAHIGWGRAILTAAIIAVVGIVACVYGTNAILTRVHSWNRHSRVFAATVWFFATLLALAWGLRRLQRSKII